MQETRVRSLGMDDPLDKEVATHSRTLVGKIPRMEEAGGLQDCKESEAIEHLIWLTTQKYVE